MTRTIDQLPKPQVRLSGVNGNVYSVIGSCRKPALDAGWTREEWENFEHDLLHNSKDYDDVLQKILRAFEVD